MRILLDACVPERLKRELSGHEVWTAREKGWSRLPDGALLNMAAGAFEVFLTVDANLPFQQNLSLRPFAVIVLRAKSNRLVDILPLIPALMRALGEVRPGEVREIST